MNHCVGDRSAAALIDHLACNRATAWRDLPRCSGNAAAEQDQRRTTYPGGMEHNDLTNAGAGALAMASSFHLAFFSNHLERGRIFERGSQTPQDIGGRRHRLAGYVELQSRA